MGYDCYVRHAFRCLDEGEVGIMQARFFDDGESALDLAEAFGVSVATVYRACASVPEEAVSAKVRRQRDEAMKHRGGRGGFKIVDDGHTVTRVEHSRQKAAS